MDKTRVCTECGIERDIALFDDQEGGKDGKRSKCKMCISLYNKKKYAEKGNKNYLDEKPSCECGGKVVIQAEELNSGSSHSDYVYMCCGCGKVFGFYRKNVLTPEHMMDIQDRSKGNRDWGQVGGKPLS